MKTFPKNLDHNTIFYTFAREKIPYTNMNEYIFYTPEGYCLAPDYSPVENFQVLGNN